VFISFARLFIDFLGFSEQKSNGNYRIRRRSWMRRNCIEGAKIASVVPEMKKCTRPIGRARTSEEERSVPVAYL
jgi:hypothetical protein